jgi:hypothetical protein
VILPLCLCVASGIVQASVSRWGLLRHYWVVCKLALTALATLVLLLKLQPISALAQAAADADRFGAWWSMLLHAGGGLLLLLMAAVLGIYKPAAPPARGDGHERTPMPAWVKLVGALALALVLVVAAMVFVGGHGPGMHSSSAPSTSG